MGNERQQILEMLANGKVTVEEAEKLLNAIGDTTSTPQAEGKPAVIATVNKPKYLRVVVSEGDDGSKVNIRVPIALLRSGIKLASIIPPDAVGKIDSSLQEKGISFSLSDIKPEMIEELIDSLSELTVDVNDRHDSVRVFCE